MKLELPDDIFANPSKNSLRRVVQRAKHSHYATLVLRIDGKDESFEADWIKHLKFEQVN